MAWLPMSHAYRGTLLGYLLILLCLLPLAGMGEVSTSQDQELNELLSLDITQLTVTSVTRSSEKSSNAAAAVYVITHDDLKLMGVTTIPQALRMVPGVQVEQTGSHNWQVTVRGFNNQVASQARPFIDQFANKLLVLMDGRSLYTIEFSGVFWDTQDTLIEDIDRIEVIRGPGVTLWGANAVNGVINIVTKKASRTQGKYLSMSVGSNEYLTTEGRYGGMIDNNTFYRVYARQRRRGEFETIKHQQAHDAWSSLASGFQLDQNQDTNQYTIQGDIYNNSEDSTTTLLSSNPPSTNRFIADNTNTGGNILGRWNHAISDTSNTSVQLYFDTYRRASTWPANPSAVQEMSSLDADLQHVFVLTERNEIVWGGGYRYNYDKVDIAPLFTTWNAFVQDQYVLVKDRLFLTGGSKFEYNDFTGSEIQPNIRLTWQKSPTETVWSAISYAVSSPTRVQDSTTTLLVVTPGLPQRSLEFTGNKSLVSEQLTAYEAGYRIYPVPGISLDISTFYNDYDKLFTATRGTSFLQNGVIVTPLSASNEAYGYSYGFEAAANWNVNKYWQLGASYSFIDLNISATPLASNNLKVTEDAAPQHQFSVRSYLNLPYNAQWNNMIYYVDELKATNGTTLHLDPNIRLDSQLEWKPVPSMECTITGRNLFNAPHTEFPGSPIALVGPSFTGTVA